ncbi:30S ribosomal protein S6 [bacterium]|nr:30S ribosomal protein S6 [bacterium]
MSKITEQKNYKMGAIFPPDINKKEENEFLEKIKKAISELEGTISKCKILKKNFSYPIKKLHQGIYLILNFAISPDKLKHFKKKIDSEEKILRYLITLNHEKEVQKISVKSTAAPSSMNKSTAHKKPSTHKEKLSEIDFLSRQDYANSATNKSSHKDGDSINKKETSKKSKMDLKEVDKKLEEILKE